MIGSSELAVYKNTRALWFIIKNIVHTEKAWKGIKTVLIMWDDRSKRP